MSPGMACWNASFEHLVRRCILWLEYCWLSSRKLTQESGLVDFLMNETARPQLAARRRGARTAGTLQALFLMNAFSRCKCLCVKAFDAQAWCEGGWVAGRLAGTPEAPLVEVDEPPAGEGGTLEVRQFATQLQEADTSSPNRKTCNSDWTIPPDELPHALSCLQRGRLPPPSPNGLSYVTSHACCLQLP